MEDLKNIKITQLVDSIHTKNMQNLPTRFPNKKGILVLTPTLLKYMSLSLNWDFVLIPTYLLGQILVFYIVFLRSSLSNISIVWLNDHSLTDLLSYPKSRDAIASKNRIFKIQFRS